MSLASKRQSKRRATSGGQFRRVKEFGDVIAEVYIGRKGKSAGQIGGAVKLRGQWTGLTLDFICTGEACGINWGPDVEKAFLQVDEWLKDGSDVRKELEEAYMQWDAHDTTCTPEETEVEPTAKGALAARMQSKRSS